jgi:Radical SAM superfamily
MRVALVYRGRYHVRQALDLETLAPVIRSGGHTAELVYDSNVFGVTDNVLQIPWLARRLSSPKKSARRLLSRKPDVAIFMVLPNTYGWARETAELLKKDSSIPTIFIGLHPTLAPERVMKDAFVDFVVQGETEDVILPLLKAIEERAEVDRVGNLWHRRNGEATFTHKAPLTNLDALPLPDKALFHPYIKQTYSYSAMVSRGCPFACSFCEETCHKQILGAGYFRRKTVDTVMDELLAARKQWKFREVIFKDSYLSGDRKWLGALMERYRREIGVPFKCFCTVKGFDEETARLLKDGGCYNIEFGLQTWNESIRADVLHRAETNDEARHAFGLCAKTGLWYDVDHMFDLPGELIEDHALGAQEYRALKRLNRVKVHRLVYLPSADILKSAQQGNLVPADFQTQLEDGLTTDFYDAPIGDPGARRAVAGYAALYKLLPAMPRWLVGWFTKKHRARFLRWIPSPIMAFLQGLIALRSRDLRFATYVRFYPGKVLRGIRDGMKTK